MKFTRSLISRCNEYENRIGKQSTVALVDLRYCLGPTTLNSSIHSYIEFCSQLCFVLSLLFFGMRMTSGQVHFKCLILNWRRNIDKNNRWRKKIAAPASLVFGLCLENYTLYSISHSQSWSSCFVCLFDLFCFFFLKITWK